MTNNWKTTQYISAIVATSAIAILWIDDVVGILIIALMFWLFVPALIISTVSFFLSLQCNIRHKRILLAWHSLNILALILWITNPNSNCNADIMEKHYESHKENFCELYQYVNNHLKPGCGISLEFENEKVSIFHVIGENGLWSNEWNPTEERIDSLLKESGLNRKHLDYIKKELKKTHCISIKAFDDPTLPYTIGFRRIGMGMYSFKIYNRILSADEKKIIDEDCSTILYTSSVVFEYSGGAIGNQCFIGKEEYLKNKAKKKHL